MSGTGATSWQAAYDVGVRDRGGCIADLRRELDQARLHVTRLEAEVRMAERAWQSFDSRPKAAPPESPTIVLACNIAIGGIMAIPLVWLVTKFVERVLG